MQEELYLVQQGRAVFELDGERVDAPAGTFVFARPDVKRTAFAEEPGTTIVALGGTPGKAYEPNGGELWMPLDHSTRRASTPRLPTAAAKLVEANPSTRAALQPRVLRKPRRPDSRGARPPPARDRAGGAVPHLAQNDSDFDPIRDDPTFKELTQLDLDGPRGGPAEGKRPPALGVTSSSPARVPAPRRQPCARAQPSTSRGNVALGPSGATR